MNICLNKCMNPTLKWWNFKKKIYLLMKVYEFTSSNNVSLFDWSFLGSSMVDLEIIFSHSIHFFYIPISIVLSDSKKKIKSGK